MKLIQIVSVASRTSLDCILELSPNIILIGSQDGKIKLYETNKYSLHSEMKLDGSITSISPSSDRLEVNLVNVLSIVSTFALKLTEILKYCLLF